MSIEEIGFIVDTRFKVVASMTSRRSEKYETLKHSFIKNGQNLLKSRFRLFGCQIMIYV